MNRLIIPRIAVLLLVVVLVGRLYQLQLLDAEVQSLRYQQVNATRFVRERPLRGEVFASDGTTLLAETVPIYSAAIRPADLDREIDKAGTINGPLLREATFARLNHLLGITSTLTISPAMALDQNTALASDLQQGLGIQTSSIQRQSAEVPQQLRVRVSQGAMALALTNRYSDTLTFTPASGVQDLQADATPAPTAITGTLTIDPPSALLRNPELRRDMEQVFGQQTISDLGGPLVRSWASVDVPPTKSMVALQLARVYSTTVSLDSNTAHVVANTNVPGYETVTIKTDIPRDIALVLRENATSLPGVVVEEDYRRRYPLSNQIQSLSHILGYIGGIDDCELVTSNPSQSWSESLFDVAGNAIECGVLNKPIDRSLLGQPRYLNNDRIGKEGVEASYEQELRGHLGTTKIVVNALGQPVREPEIFEPTRDGNNLVLTVDIGLQKQVEEIVKNWIAVGEQRREALPSTGVDAYKRKYRPIRSGAAIVMEVKTGRVLAMVSWPAYDNNIWVDPARGSELLQFYPSDPQQQKEMQQLSPLTNRNISGTYPPGSTIKQFDAAVALQSGLIRPDTRVFDPGKLVLPNKYNPADKLTIGNAGLRARGDITVSDALMVSSNVFFMSVIGGTKDVENLAPEQRTLPGIESVTAYADALGEFGFGKPTGIQLAGERRGVVPTPAWKQAMLQEAWTTGDTYNMSIGQGNLEVTPIQLAAAGAAIANNGTLYRPQIVKEIRDNNGQLVSEIQPEISHEMSIDKSYLTVIREGMRRSVTEGANIAARDACSGGLQIAGKTGTAEFGDYIVPGDSSTRQTHSWFVSFAPYDDPQIEVVVLSEGTGSIGDGSATIAVPMATQIMQSYFNIAPPAAVPPGCQQGLPPLPQRTNPTVAVSNNQPLSR